MQAVPLASVIIAMLLWGCGDPPFVYEQRMVGELGSNLDVRADGQPVVGTPLSNPAFVEYLIVRRYDDWRAATGQSIRIQVFQAGEVRWEVEADAQPCARFGDECGTLTRAFSNISLEADGTPAGLSGSLQCYDEHGECAGVISSLPAGTSEPESVVSR